MRSIDGDALKSKLQARHDNGNEDFDKGYNVGLGTAIDLIDCAPTMDKPVLVMFDTARWERDVNDNLNIMIRFGWKCSACEKRQSYGMTPHCPFCGAEMINGSKFQEGE